MHIRASTRPRWRRIALLIIAWCAPIPASAQSSSPKPTLHNLREVGKALGDCISPLPIENRYQGIRITVRLSFNGHGQLLGAPRFTYITPSAPERFKSEYKDGISDALKRCTPLDFSPEFGAGIAGLPLYLRFNEGGLIPANYFNPTIRAERDYASLAVNL
jgi:hypothetical protein